VRCSLHIPLPRAGPEKLFTPRWNKAPARASIETQAQSVFAGSAAHQFKPTNSGWNAVAARHLPLTPTLTTATPALAGTFMPSVAPHRLANAADIYFTAGTNNEKDGLFGSLSYNP
jgi:hypothetical protein